MLQVTKDITGLLEYRQTATLTIGSWSDDEDNNDFGTFNILNGLLEIVGLGKDEDHAVFTVRGTDGRGYFRPVDVTHFAMIGGNAVIHVNYNK